MNSPLSPLRRQHTYTLYQSFSRPARSYSRRSYFSFINNVVTLFQVLHIAQDDLLIYQTKMLDQDCFRFIYIV